MYAVARSEICDRRIMERGRLLANQEVWFACVREMASNLNTMSLMFICVNILLF